VGAYAWICTSIYECMEHNAGIRTYGPFDGFSPRKKIAKMSPIFSGWSLRCMLKKRSVHVSVQISEASIIGRAKRRKWQNR